MIKSVREIGRISGTHEVSSESFVDVAFPPAPSLLERLACAGEYKLWIARGVNTVYFDRYVKAAFGGYHHLPDDVIDEIVEDYWTQAGYCEGFPLTPEDLRRLLYGVEIGVILEVIVKP